MSHTSCDLLLIGAVGTCYQLHLLQTSQRSLPSTEDAWEMQDTRAGYAVSLALEEEVREVHLGSTFPLAFPLRSW